LTTWILIEVICPATCTIFRLNHINNNDNSQVFNEFADNLPLNTDKNLLFSFYLFERGCIYGTIRQDIYRPSSTLWLVRLILGQPGSLTVLNVSDIAIIT
jgi:hypothetical protein